MVDLQPKSAKLRARAERLVRDLGGVSAARVGKLLEQAGGSAKVAVVMARRRVTAAEARRRLRAAGGFLGRAAGI
jgi:N-acetylmuramic acid 6-phosphate etherase